MIGFFGENIKINGRNIIIKEVIGKKFMNRSKIQIEKNYCVLDKLMNKGIYDDVFW